MPTTAHFNKAELFNFKLVSLMRKVSKQANHAKSCRLIS